MITVEVQGERSSDTPGKGRKRGIASDAAWEAAKKVAKTIRKERSKNVVWRRWPWEEIKDQLRRRGDVVDPMSVPPTWTSESPQMRDLIRILEEAGFEKDGHVYRWPG